MVYRWLGLTYRHGLSAQLIKIPTLAIEIPRVDFIHDGSYMNVLGGFSKVAKLTTSCFFFVGASVRVTLYPTPTTLL